MKTRKRKLWKQALGMLIAVAVIAFSSTSCGDNGHKKDDDVESFKVFVTDLKAKSEEELKEDWEAIEKEYKEKVTAIDQKTDELENEIKQDYEQLKKDYQELKAKYSIQMMKDEGDLDGNLQKLYEVVLTNEGDMDLSGVTTSNIVAVYAGFVEIVDFHKDEYTREDWDEVDILWDALNKRKNELEDNLSNEQRMKISEDKVKYGTFKTLNKLPAKSEEKNQ